MEARDHGDSPGTQGGDPVTVELATHTGILLDTKVKTTFWGEHPAQVCDLDNGSYEVRFTPAAAGTYCLSIFIFARPIKVTFSSKIVRYKVLHAVVSQI